MSSSTDVTFDKFDNISGYAYVCDTRVFIAKSGLNKRRGPQIRSYWRFWPQTLECNQLNGSFWRIISRIISFAARKDVAVARYVLIKRQKLKVLLDARVVNPGSLTLSPSYLSSFLSHVRRIFFPSTLRTLSPNLVLFVLHLSLFRQRVVHDSFESASPRGPGIDSRLSRRLLLPWRPSCNRH